MKQLWMSFLEKFAELFGKKEVETCEVTTSEYTVVNGENETACGPVFAYKGKELFQLHEDGEARPLGTHPFDKIYIVAGQICIIRGSTPIWVWGDGSEEPWVNEAA